MKSKSKRRIRRAYALPPPGARYGSVNETCAYLRCGRNSVYLLIKQHPEIARKLHGKTLIDLRAVDVVLVGTQ
jgi:hypothetical protein